MYFRYMAFSPIKMLDSKRIENFWSKFEKTNTCWLWTGTKNNRGYGLVRFRMKVQLSHRLSYQLTNNDLKPQDIVMHTCDTPLCGNPAHLIKTTQSDNMQDWWNKRKS